MRAGRTACVVVAIAFLGFTRTVTAQCPTCPGDVSNDAIVNGDDIQVFSNCLFLGGVPMGDCLCADMDASGIVDVAGDLAPFVTALLSPGPCATGTLTLTLDDPLVGVTRSIGGTVCLSQPAPAGGLLVTLDSLDPGIATISPAMVTIPAGAMCETITVDGIALGSTTVTADAVGISQATAPITVTSAVISLGVGLQLIPGQTAGLAVSLSVPAPAGGVTISFSSSDPLVASIDPSVFIPAGQQIPAFNPQVTGNALGSVIISATAASFAPDMRSVVVASNVITLDPTTLNVVETLMADMTVNLQVSAPPGGQLIDISIDDPGIASTPISAFVPAGENSVDVPVTGVFSGSTTFRASAAAASIPEATADINVGPAGINLSGNTIGENLEVAAFGSLTAAAPAGNLDVTITSTDPASLLLSTNATNAGSASIMVTVNAGATSIPTFYVHALTDVGSAGITATAGGYLPGSATFQFQPSGFFIWSPSVINAVTGQSATNVQLRPARLNPTTLAYVDDQQVRGGFSVGVGVTSSVPAVGAITTSPVVFNGGDFFKNTGFDPLSAGVSVVDVVTPVGFATPSNFQSITANVSNQGILLTDRTIGKDLQMTGIGSLTAPAPAGNLDVTITSLDPSSVLLATDPTAAGTASIMVTVGAGQTGLPTFYVHSLVDTGTADITATAPGYGAGTATMTLDPSGFIIWTPSSINTFTGQSPTNVQVRGSRLNPTTLAYADDQNLRGGFSVNVDVLSSDPVVGTMTVSPVVFNGNDIAINTGFDPMGAGTCDVSLVAPLGFSTPSNLQSISATVLDQGINLNPRTIGDDLQMSVTGNLTAPAPPGNLDVTITSTEPARLLLSVDPTQLGAASAMVAVGAGSTNLPTFYAQALDDSGTVDIVATAPGYGPGTGTMTLNPSGFIIWSPGSITTTTFSNPTNVQLRPARLNPATMAYADDQNLRGGFSVGVSLMSSDTNVGVPTIDPVVFNGHDIFQNTGFDPLIAGTTDLSIVTPPGFDTPSNLQLITATVNAPTITIADTTVGEDLQQARPVTLQSAPPNPVDVTVTVNDPTIATISDDPLLAGGSSVTFFGVTGTSAGTIYIQGRLLGDTTLTSQAAGYSDSFTDVTVDPSGFMIWSPSTINTTTFSNNTNVQIRSARLNPTTLNYADDQNVRGGLSVMVDIVSSDPAVGTIAVSPITFNANDLFMNAAFDPLGAGTCDVSVPAPAGFDLPSNFQQITANVTAPAINITDTTLGEDLQLARSVTLTATPPGPVDITITSSDPSVAVVSDDALTLGGASVTLFGVTSTNAGTIYIQGLTQGMSTTLTSTGLGYAPSTADITVDPSGFIIWSPSSINTNTYANPTNVQIRAARLHPTTLNYSDDQNVRGGLTVMVDVTSSDPLVGTMTTSPLTFGPNTLFGNTSFDPDTVGTSDVTVVTPAGFDTSSNLRISTATVSVPTITIADVTVGEDLQQNRSVILQSAPPVPVDVTVTSNDPLVSVVSSDPALPGGASVTFFGVTGTSAGTVHVQGLMQGMTTTLTTTAPGYAAETTNVTVDPSGFIIWSPSSITTTVASNDSNIQIRPARLNPTTLNYADDQSLRGGLSVPVTVTSSNTAVGTITISPLSFLPNGLFLNTAFSPVAAGTSMVEIVTPAGFDSSSNLREITATVNP